jgi:hypothetical protein
VLWRWWSCEPSHSETAWPRHCEIAGEVKSFVIVRIEKTVASSSVWETDGALLGVVWGARGVWVRGGGCKTLEIALSSWSDGTYALLS